MIALAKRSALLARKPAPLWIDGDKHHILFARAGLLFAFNLHPTRSEERVFVSCARTGAGAYRVLLSSDCAEFGGQDRVRCDTCYRAENTEYGLGFFLYLPARTAVVLEKVRK